MKNDEISPARVTIFSIMGIFVLILGLMILFGSWYTIPAGYKGIVLTMGKPGVIATDPGFHLKMPIIQSVVKMDTRTQKYETDAGAASKDLQVVHTKLAVNYHLMPGLVTQVYSEIGLGYSDQVIQPAVQEIVKANTALFTAEQLITERPQVKDGIKLGLVTRLIPRGIVIEEISMTDFDFSESFNVAIEQKVTAEQLKLKAERDLQRIMVEAQQKVATANGDKLAIIAKAEAEAYAVEMINKQLSKSPQYIEWLKAQKWDGKLPQYTGGWIPFMNVGQVTPNAA